MGEKCGCGEGHAKHMCELIKNQTPTEEIKKIVGDAQFICKGCGRSAEKEENLCAPEEL